MAIKAMESPSFNSEGAGAVSIPPVRRVSFAILPGLPGLPGPVLQRSGLG
jgi:hypothetical protein